MPRNKCRAWLALGLAGLLLAGCQTSPRVAFDIAGHREKLFAIYEAALQELGGLLGSPIQNLDVQAVITTDGSYANTQLEVSETPWQSPVIMGFGILRDPFSSKFLFHDGIRIAAPFQQAVINLRDGKIISLVNAHARRQLTISSGNFEFDYLDINFDPNLKLHQLLRQGQLLGQVSTCLGCLGPSIKLRIRYKGILIDPELILAL